MRQELSRLARLELVSYRRDGNRTCYRANQEHPLYPDIRNLTLKTSGLTQVLQSALAGQRIRVAFVFGSMASGMDSAHSDVGLMVIGDIGLRELGRRLSGVSLKLGRPINPHVLDTSELKRRKKARDHFLTSVLASPKSFIVGTEDELAGLG